MVWKDGFVMSKVSGGGKVVRGGVMDKLHGDKGKKGGSPLGFVEKIDLKNVRR